MKRRERQETRRALRRRTRAVVFGAVAACTAAYGCSLGLDASKIGAASVQPKEDASLPAVVDASLPDVAAPIVADAALPTEAEAGPPVCVVDTECTSTNGCQVGACDAGACSFAVCPTSACQGSSCTLATSACTAPVAYGFHAAEVTVALGAVGCGGNVASCLAATYPFVFVGTANGVIAYDVSDPSNASPRVVPIAGVPFLPSFLTAMGSRVYFVGAPQGSGPSYRLAVATLDVPSDPLTTSLQATTVFQVISVTSIGGAWAGADGSLFLANDNLGQSLPVAHVAPPFTDGAAFTFYSSPDVPAGAYPVVPSGSRLVMAHWIGSATPYQTAFSFETAAGASGAQNSGDTLTAATIGPTAPQSTYAQGDDGSVVWNTATSVTDDAGGDDLGSARVAWLVSSGTSGKLAPAQFVDVESYVPAVPYGSVVVGPVAWVDSITALVLAAASGTVGSQSPGQTSVQVAVSSPTPKLVDNRRYVVPQSVGQVAAAASGGFGYVLAAGSAGVAGCTLHIFAPGCATP